MEIEILDSSGGVINTIIADAEFANEFYPNRWRERVSPEPVPPSLDEVKADKISEIKAEAERRIVALNWRLQRAQEREQLGETGVETVADVLALREQIRQASNATEAAVAQLTDVAGVTAFYW